MNTERFAPTDIDDRTRSLVNDLVRDVGLFFKGIDEENFLAFEAFNDIPPDRQRSLGRDIMQIFMREDLDDAVKQLRDKTNGISIRS